MTPIESWVKVCGITTPEDALLVADAGADALGINLWPQSPRGIGLEAARQIAAAVRGRLQIVAVTVDMTIEELRDVLTELQPDRLQLHGDEEDSRVAALQPHAFKAIGLEGESDVERARTVPGEIVLVDARDTVQRGGTGRAPPWELAARVCAARPTVLAGGLGVGNIGEAIRTCRPAGVDAASRLELEPGRKHKKALRAFVEEARAAFAGWSGQGS